MSSLGRSVPKFLFCYACRPNFHHKYLTLSDPPLSACGEALISRHTCADRPEILKLEPRMRLFFSHVRLGALVHVAQSDGGLSVAAALGCRRRPALLKSVSVCGGQTLLCLWTSPCALAASSRRRKGESVTVSCEANIYHPLVCFGKISNIPRWIRRGRGHLNTSNALFLIPFIPG